MVQPASKRLVTEAKLADEIDALGLGTAATADASDFAPAEHDHVPPTYVMLTADYAGGTPVRPLPIELGHRCMWICSTSAVPASAASGTGGMGPRDFIGGPV